jgi:signal transduction histidine kinase
LNEVLGRILGNLIRIIPHDSAAITILEDDHVRVARQYSDRSNRDTQEIFAERELQVEYKLYLDIMYETQKPIIVADLQDDLENVRDIAMRADVRSYIGAPILLQNQVIGFINVFSVQPNFFIEPHAERLSAFAELAAVAIQNAQLYQQSQELAAIEERQRLARDLHDSVSQTLFTCKNMAESAVRRWNKDPARSKELMDEVLQLTLTALAEMRILLLELRPAALTQIKLKQLFQQYLQPIQDRRQFGLAVEIDDVPTLPPDVQIALYRIAQEALNNIDKHARARNVELKIKSVNGRLELHIRDDGEGFEVDRVSSTSLGLEIMRERANQIGAQLNIESEIGTGTEVSLVWNRS